MKLSVLALDYDGTVARDDTLDPGVREAIATARERGIVVLLVTGRILDELRRVAGDLHFVDGVVAENGAVIHFPDSEHTSMLAPPVPEAYLTELARRGIAFRAGQCLVDANADDALCLVEVIRALELPLVLVFNRGRVMTKSEGVSKATGLHAMLDTLRLSARNTLAIGDAENDHELLRLSEIGAAVEWGSGSLKGAADVVVPGSGPTAVAQYVQALAHAGRLPVPRRARRGLRLGHTEDGREFSLAERGLNVLVAGDLQSGKSWITGLLCEQLILHGYCVCVVDPQGDYRSLEALPGVTVLGGDDPLPMPRDLCRALRYPDRSVVIDLSRLPQDQKVAYARAVLPALNVLRRRTGLPHRIVVDEAHCFLHDVSANHLLDLELNGYTVVTHCASRLPPELLAATEVMIVTRASDPGEVRTLCQCCPNCGNTNQGWWPLLGQLKPGQAAALPAAPEAGGDIRLFTVGRRLTPHVRRHEKYVDMPVTDDRAFVFEHNGRGAPHRRACTLRQFIAALEGTDAGILAGYLHRHDFSRWMADVFGDRGLAEELRALEERYAGGRSKGVVPDIISAIRSRYDLIDDETVESSVQAPSAAALS